MGVRLTENEIKTSLTPNRIDQCLELQLKRFGMRRYGRDAREAKIATFYLWILARFVPGFQFAALHPVFTN
jgi:hypothetical protein